MKQIGEDRFALPINIDLIFRLLAIITLFNPYLFRQELKLPFLRLFDELGGTANLQVVITVLTVTGGVLVFFRISMKIGSGLMALGILLTILGCKPCYSDSRAYIFSLLFLLSIYHKNWGTQLLRFQVIVLYLGSGINKLFDLHWQSGVYIENWLVNKMENPVYITISSIFPEMFLARSLSWSVIAVELFIALCFTRRRLFGWGILLGFMLHAGSMVASNGVFGAFVIGTFISYLSFLEFPPKVLLLLPPKNIFKLFPKLAFLIDPYGKMDVAFGTSDHKFELYLFDQKYAGWKALRHAIVYLPISYFALVIFFIMPPFGHVWAKAIIVVAVSLFAFPVLMKAGGINQNRTTEA